MYKILLLLLLPLHILAQQPSAQPLSERIARYNIKTRLDDTARTIEGSLRLQWTNTSTDTLGELQFHLYLNAFRNTYSTFMLERHADVSTYYQNQDKSYWGYTDVVSIQTDSGADLTDNMRFIAPDDGNVHDRTVLSVQLKDSLLPKQIVTLDIIFTSKLPHLIARTGYANDYFFVAQWFPKIGVYESAQKLGSAKGAWNCHQFHANSEFYADFATYNVQITLPQKYVVGTTGILTAQNNNTDGTKTLQYQSDDILDFAWTASPRFVAVNSTWEHVNITALMQPEHLDQADRHIEAARTTLAYMAAHLAKYPYTNLTIVDPPLYGSGSAGMEYTTMVTAGTVWGLPAGIRMPELVTIHEIGHAYFMGMLASNEFEESWMDEGMNSYYEARIMDETYGALSSVVDWQSIRVGNLQYQRDEYTQSDNPKIAESSRKSWEYKHGGYGMLSYSKPATWMTTLDRMVGRTCMDNIMQMYFEKWKFKHPTARDFAAVATDVVRTHHGKRFGDSLGWFFEQVIEGSNICDYKVAHISNAVLQRPAGVDASTIVYDSASYLSRVVLHRLGELILPVEVLVKFDNGDEKLELWDGRSRTYELSYIGKNKIVLVRLDPENKLLLDVNQLNNSIDLNHENSTLAWKYFTKLLFWIQNLIQSIGIFA